MIIDSSVSLIASTEGDETISKASDDTSTPTDARLDQTEREIIGKVVHDLRNISCVILGNLELLEECDYPGAKQMIDRAITGTNRLTTIIASLTELRRAKPSTSE